MKYAAFLVLGIALGYMMGHRTEVASKYSAPIEARPRREAGGWRVIYLKNASIFTESGLQQGDLITDAALEPIAFTPF